MELPGIIQRIHDSTRHQKIPTSCVGKATVAEDRSFEMKWRLEHLTTSPRPDRLYLKRWHGSEGTETIPKADGPSHDPLISDAIRLNSS